MRFQTVTLGWVLLVLCLCFARPSIGQTPPTSALNRQNFESALKQIREKHLDLFSPLFDNPQDLENAVNSLLGDGRIQGKDSQLQVGRVTFRFVPVLKTPEERGAGGFTYPPTSPGGNIVIELNAQWINSMWRLKDTLIHELGHALMFAHLARGNWESGAAGQTVRTENVIQNHVICVHECCCYGVNLGLLSRLVCEFPQHRPEIRKRFRQKVTYLEVFFQRSQIALEFLRKQAHDSSGKPESSSAAKRWARFGLPLKEMLLRMREPMQIARLRAVRYCEEELRALEEQEAALNAQGPELDREEKKNRAAQTDCQSIIRRLVSRLNALGREKKVDTKAQDQLKAELQEQRAELARLATKQKSIEQQKSAVSAALGRIKGERGALRLEIRQIQESQKNGFIRLYPELKEPSRVAETTRLQEKVDKALENEEAAAQAAMHPSEKTVPVVRPASGKVSLQEATRERMLTMEARGLGRASGEVFLCGFALQSLDLNLNVTLPQGTVFVPDSPSVQRIMLSESVDFSLSSSNPRTEVALRGYCLDPDLLPPPTPDQIAAGAPNSRWRVLSEHDDPTAYAMPLAIIRAGDSLAADGQFHNDLPSNQHHLTVVQRALWHHISPQKFDKKRLKADLEEQLRERDSKATPEQVEQLTDHLWQDIDLTLKSASRRQHSAMPPYLRG